MAGAVLAIAFEVLAAPNGTAQGVAYTGSVQVASGDYTFGQRSTSTYFANGLTFDVSRAHLSFSVPLVAQSEGWVQYVGGTMVPSGGMHREGSPASSGSRNGMMTRPQDDDRHGVMGVGDPIVRAEVDLLGGEGGRALLRAALATKMPVAGLASGFGTGEWDYGAGLSAAGAVAETFLFADATYWALGDPPSVELRDIVSYGLGVGRPIAGGRFALLGSLLGATPVADGIPASLQLGGSVSYRGDAGRGVSLTIMGGLTRSAPDVAIGLGWRVPLR